MAEEQALHSKLSEHSFLLEKLQRDIDLLVKETVSVGNETKSLKETFSDNFRRQQELIDCSTKRVQTDVLTQGKQTVSEVKDELAMLSFNSSIRVFHQKLENVQAQISELDGTLKGSIRTLESSIGLKLNELEKKQYHQMQTIICEITEKLEMISHHRQEAIHGASESKSAPQFPTKITKKTNTDHHSQYHLVPIAMGQSQWLPNASTLEIKNDTFQRNSIIQKQELEEISNEGKRRKEISLSTDNQFAEINFDDMWESEVTAAYRFSTREKNKTKVHNRRQQKQTCFPQRKIRKEKPKAYEQPTLSCMKSILRRKRKKITRKASKYVYD